MSRILVADDHEVLRGGIARVLTNANHEVTQVANGNAAIEELHRGQYDVIVSDLKMPGLDGPSLYLELTRRWPDTRPHLLFISGFVDSPEYVGFLQGTRVQVLLKPFAVDDLSRAVSHLLSQS